MQSSGTVPYSPDVASSPLLDALSEPPLHRECWACDGERTTSKGDGLCYLCGGDGTLPSNPLDRRRGEFSSLYPGPERRKLTSFPPQGFWLPGRTPSSASTRARSEPILMAAIWNALGLIRLRSVA